MQCWQSHQVHCTLPNLELQRTCSPHYVSDTFWNDKSTTILSSSMYLTCYCYWLLNLPPPRLQRCQPFSLVCHW